MNLKHVSAVLVMLVLGLVFASTLPAQAASNAQAATCDQTYTVVAGDTLSSVALKLLGDLKAYTQIVDATNNAAKTDTSFKAISNPDAIDVGLKLCIPAKSATAGTTTASGTTTPSASGTISATVTTTAPVATKTPAPTAALGGAAAGLYANTGPAADASALVYLVTLDPNGGAVVTTDYVGKSNSVSTGTWSQSGTTVTLNLTQPSAATVVFTAGPTTLTTTQDNSKIFGAPGFVLTKTAAATVVASGIYNTTIPGSNGAADSTVALTLTPDGKALFIQNTGSTSTTETGTWTLSGTTLTVNLTKNGTTAVTDNYTFTASADQLVSTAVPSGQFPNGLTLKKVEGIGATTATAPAAAGSTTAAATATPPPGSLEGTYIQSMPGGDVSAVLWELTIAPNGNAAWLTNYVGRGTSNATGTWEQTSPTGLTLTLLHQDDKNINQTFLFELQGDKLVATQYPQSQFGDSGLFFYRADAKVSGNVSYTEKIALPNDAVVEVYLLDVTTPNQPGTYISGVSYSANGQQVPLPFEVPYDSTQVKADGKYIVQAFISSSGKLLFSNQNGVAVITGGAPTSNVQLPVTQVGP